MTCGAVREWLPELATGALDSVRTVAAYDHLRACADCRTELVATVRLQEAALRTFAVTLTPKRRDLLWHRIAARLPEAPVQGTGAAEALGPIWEQIRSACVEPARRIGIMWADTARSLREPWELVSHILMEKG